VELLFGNANEIHGYYGNVMSYVLVSLAGFWFVIVSIFLFELNAVIASLLVINSGRFKLDKRYEER
jgi:hypothetical protein